MDSLSKELVMIIVQFLREENFTETAHSLEKESGFYFNMKYFEEKVLAGEWDEAEKYLSGFTKVADNAYSMKIYFELRKQKYLEALDRKDKPEALKILVNDLKVFSVYNKELYRNMTELLTLQNFRENAQLLRYGAIHEARVVIMLEVRKLIQANPALSDKLAFPILKSQRLRTLMNQSLNWQHLLCRNQNSYPEIQTLYTDHSCGSSNGGFAAPPFSFPYAGSANPGTSVPLAISAPFPRPAANLNALASRVLDAHAAATLSVQPNQVAGIKRRLNTPAVTPGYSSFEQIMKRLRAEDHAEKNAVDALGRVKGISNPVDDVVDKSTKPWRQLAEILEPIRCRLVTLNASDSGNKVSRLLYTNSGTGLLVLGSSGLQKLWKWLPDEQNPNGKATAKASPYIWQPNSGLLMANDIAGVNLDEACPCIALTSNDSYAMGAYGGKVSLFSTKTYKVMATFMTPPPVCTSLAFDPQDNNTLAVGKDDSNIYIYHVRSDEVKFTMKGGHQSRVTCLAFAPKLNILISSGADARFCTWSTHTWEKIKSSSLELPADTLPTGDTRVQIHSNEVRFLVSHETQLALYGTALMERIQQWIPQDALSAPISYATFSCNSELVYASFRDGNVGIFDGNSLRLRNRLCPSVYLSLKGNEVVYPVVVAAHPQDPHQFALGLTDGTVKVVEPLDPEGRWGESQPADKGLISNGRDASASTSNRPAADQQLQK